MKNWQHSILNNPVDRVTPGSARIHERFSRLRQLQEQEAAAIERHFALHLALPIGAGQQLLEEARELIRRHESPPPSN